MTKAKGLGYKARYVTARAEALAGDNRPLYIRVMRLVYEDKKGEAAELLIRLSDNNSVVQQILAAVIADDLTRAEQIINEHDQRTMK